MSTPTTPAPAAAVAAAAGRTLVWDCSGLLHAARADRLDVLAEHAKGSSDAPWRSLTSTYVAYELDTFGFAVPSWVSVEPDALVDQTTLPVWIDRVGAGRKHMGEATVLNLAENRRFTAIIDDADARRVAAKYGSDVHGVLWVIAAPVTRGECSELTAASLVDQLIDTGARFPFPRGGFIDWARRVGLL